MSLTLTVAEGVSLWERNVEASKALQGCPRCGNQYLEIRHDMYADCRRTVHCDCCEAMAEPELWNRIEPMHSCAKGGAE